MMTKAKNIIATFLKIDSSEIDENTRIDSSVISGSVLIHRMYSVLSTEGYYVTNKDKIRTYGDFLKELNQGTTINNISEKNNKKELIKSNKSSSDLLDVQVGIDIEDIVNMPVVTDYREDRFYIDNFSSKEISYCILQADPRASFAGKFSLKEAIIKADNDYKSIPLMEIEILNDSLGKPIFNGFALSISHTTDKAIAVAIKGSSSINTEIDVKKYSNKMNYVSFVLSIIAISFVIYQNL